VHVASAIETLGAFEALRADPGETLRYVVLDVFTDTPLEGNQLAVFTDAPELTGARMQQIARELNLSETVFFQPAEDDSDLRVRIFTPTVEMPFAGHPTLGSAMVASWALDRSTIRLQTGSGSVLVEVERRGERRAFGRMHQPLPSWAPFDGAEQLLSALGLSASGLPVEIYDNGVRHVYVEAGDEDALASLRPDQGALLSLGELGINCFAGAGQRWKTRMFAPGLGVAEDPATGSAAGPLAVHLARHGRIEFGEEIEIRQGAEVRRPSVLHARASGSQDSLERVEVGGSAVLVAAGEFALE
jgi:trans-2,3-dihydro-3-hydroxyanthranilate isomerase